MGSLGGSLWSLIFALIVLVVVLRVLAATLAMVWGWLLLIGVLALGVSTWVNLRRYQRSGR